IPENEPVAVTKNFFYAMFSNIIVSANGKIVHDDMGLSPYRILIPKIITNSTGEEQSILTTTLCYPDKKMENYDFTTNPGFKYRADIAKQSKTFDMIGNIDCGLFNQSKYIPSGVQINLRLVRSAPEFCLEEFKTEQAGVTGCLYKFSIEEARLFVKVHKVHPDIIK